MTLDADPSTWSERMRERGGDRELIGKASGMCVLDELCCTDGRGFAGPGQDDRFAVVLQKAGGFLRRADGREDFIDATSVLLLRPGTEIFHAHPLGAGDRGTAIVLSEAVVNERFDEGRLLGGGRRIASGRLHLAHRRLVAACRRGTDEFELGEMIHAVFDAIPPGRPERSRRPSTAMAHRRLVNEACEVLGCHADPLDLDRLARLVATSPHHLSRVFRSVTGRTLTDYRNKLRVGAVLRDIEDGATCLRTLAGRYGFADQAHLTRVIRRHIGETPSAMRRLLGNRA